MRKLLFFVAVLATFGYGCTSQEPEITSPKVDETPQNVIVTTSSIRTLEEAAAIARDAVGMLPAPTSRSYARTFNITNTKILKNTSPSRGVTTDTLMYVFNFDNEQGYAIVAANRNLEPLVAVTEQGYYNPDEPIENPGFADFMARAEAAANREFAGDTLRDTAIKIPFEPIDPELAQYKSVDEIIEEQKIEPNYNLKWGQRYPEGILYDNKVAGCTNVAMAMIMSYFNAPQTINLTYNNLNETLSLNWTELKQHTQSFFDYNNDYCTAHYPYNHATISKLLKQLGELNHSYPCIEYDDNGEPYDATATPIGSPIKTFNTLGYNITGYGDVTEHILSMIHQGYKMFIYGYNKDNGYAHNWIIDGMHYKKTRHSEWIKEYGKDWEIIGDYSYYESKSIHCNWGWRGKDNGWFNINYYYLSPANGRPDEGCSTGSKAKYINLMYLAIKK